MTKKVLWDTVDGEVEFETDTVDIPVSHWFCHRCKGHFGLPVYEIGDPSMLFHCPACGSIEIEEEEPAHAPGLVR